MMALFSKDVTGLQRVCWLSILLFIVAVYYVSIAPPERAIVVAQAQAEGLYERANANDAIVRNASTLQAARSRVVADVVRLRGEDSGSTSMAHAIRLLDSEGSRYHVDIAAISPEAVATPTVTDPLVGQEVALSATGHFRDLVQLLADLPQHDVLLKIHDVQLQSKTRAAASSPVLDATLHVTLYRLSPLSSNEVSDVTGTLR